MSSISHWGLSEALLHGGGTIQVTAEQTAQIASFEDLGNEFRELLSTLPNQGRAAAIATTKIDEALHWVREAILS